MVSKKVSALILSAVFVASSFAQAEPGDINAVLIEAQDQRTAITERYLSNVRETQAKIVSLEQALVSQQATCEGREENTNKMSRGSAKVMLASGAGLLASLVLLNRGLKSNPESAAVAVGLFSSVMTAFVGGVAALDLTVFRCDELSSLYDQLHEAKRNLAYVQQQLAQSLNQKQ